MNKTKIRNNSFLLYAGAGVRVLPCGEREGQTTKLVV